jgi:hypothetical protein
MSVLVNRSNCIILLFGIAIMLSTGCASIVHPGPDAMTFSSQPPNATVTIDGKVIGQTPVTVKVERRSESVTFNLAGYEETKVPIGRELNGWVFGNIIFGGIIGLAVDFATNNINEGVPSMSVDLHHNATSAIDVKSSLAWLRSRTPEWLDPGKRPLDSATP